MPKVLQFPSDAAQTKKTARTRRITEAEALASLMDADALACANDILARNPGLTGREFVSYMMRAWWEISFDIKPGDLRAAIVCAKRDAAEWAG